MPDVIQLLNHYGYIVLFLSLMLELIIVPIPNEALMSYVGVLCYQGQMNLVLSVASAALGGMLGVSISYWLGKKLGVPFFRKYGHFIHMGPEKMDRMSAWYTKYGKVLLLVSFFIPGVRHIASIISGVIKLPFRSFSIFAYIGVTLWTGAFIWLGDIMGPKWDQFEGEIKKWLVLGSVLLGIAGILYIVIRSNRTFLKEGLFLIFESVIFRFRSFLKIKLLILFCLLLFVAAVILMVAFIQDFISNDVSPFNKVFDTIVFTLFNGSWAGIMNALYGIGSWIVLGMLALITFAVIFLNRQNIRLECTFYVVAWLGSYLLSYGIHWVFHTLMGDLISKDFPSARAMLVLTVYGLLLISLIRHSSKYILNGGMVLLAAFLLAAYAVSSVYLSRLTPSEVMAGYVFGGVWLSGAIVSLELFRFLSLIKEDSSYRNGPRLKK
ncbi:VTT domain-containing protein [Peribacillus kribbensis]|uniref:VTT domain-containing protein n=1 Tax=Peribacillus kribbensis TaxID=356658 RepID=UPI000425E9AB|nr:VTT domain-containing protein [Peribacillus kribbensis]